MLKGKPFLINRIRRLLSRSEWAAKWSTLPRAKDDDNRPGMILLQVDGLAWTQLHRALDHRRMEFLSYLIKTQDYRLKPFYSGIPSTTPAVQAELFYGVLTAVPGFGFYGCKDDRRCLMYMPDCAERVVRRLQKQGGAPLLAEGTSYSNIYTGGAAEARYCIENIGITSLARTFNPIKLLLLVLFHTPQILRLMVYAGMECFLAIHDFVRGLFDRQDIVKELKFIPTRIAIVIGLRELIRFRVKMDIARGVRIIHANLVGYDEQAHRRGPSSRFAHWSLKGIDDAIKDIWHTARRAGSRSYELVIYSDHGQEQAVSYEKQQGRGVHAAVNEALHTYSWQQDDGQGFSSCERNILHSRARGLISKKAVSPAVASSDRPATRVIAPGPIGHVYLPFSADTTNKAEIALCLQARTAIPTIVFRDKEGLKAVCENKIIFPGKNPEALLGPDHPFTSEMIADIERLCRHEDAGDFIILGWHPNRPYTTFAVENGSHGGIGNEETRGFVLLPTAWQTDKTWLRPIELRNMIQRHLADGDIAAAA